MSFGNFAAINQTKPPTTYSDVYFALGEVHKESGVDPLIEMSLEPSDARLLDQHAPSKLKWVEQLAKFAKHGLFTYEALMRCNETAVAEETLNRWVRDFTGEIKGIVESQCKDVNAVLLPQGHIENTLAKLDEVCKKCAVLPIFRNNRFEEVFKRVDLLAKEALFNSKNAPAKTLEQHGVILSEALKFHKIPSKDQQIILFMFKSEITSFSAKALGLSEILSNTAIRALLKCAPSLQTIDVSDCLHLTEKAFANGHPEILKVVANGTQIAPLPKDKFPSLSCFENTNPRVICDLELYNHPITSVMWKNLAQTLQDANMIVGTPMDINTIYKEFSQYSNADSLAAVTLLRSKKLQLEFKGIKEVVETDYHYVRALIHAAKNTNQREILPAICQELIQIRLDEKNPRSEIIKEMNVFILSFLTNETSIEVEEGGKTHLKTVKAWRTDRDFYLTHTLLISLRDLTGPFKETVLQNLPMAIYKELQILLTEGDSDIVRSVNLLSQILVEMCENSREFTEDTNQSIKRSFLSLLEIPKPKQSYHNPLRDGGLEIWGDLLPIGSVTVTQVGKYYDRIFNQSILAAFVCKFQNLQDRQEVLKKILDNFSHYPKTSFPIEKLINGTIRRDNFPEKERKDVLTDLAISYQGVFQEPISDVLKDQFRQFLKKMFT